MNSLYLVFALFVSISANAQTALEEGGAHTGITAIVPKKLECTFGKIISSNNASTQTKPGQAFNLYTHAPKLLGDTLTKRRIVTLEHDGQSPISHIRKDDFIYSHLDERVTISLNRKVFSVKTMTCDSWDFHYQIDMPEMLAAANDHNKVIHGTAKVEIRGDQSISEVVCKIAN